MKLRIKFLRENAKMTQKDLADKVGSTVSNISKYELGLTEPSLDMLVRLSYVFGVTVDYLLGISNAPGKENTAATEELAGPDLDYVYMMGADGSRKRVYIPPEKAVRFSTLIDAGFPELMEE